MVYQLKDTSWIWYNNPSRIILCCELSAIEGHQKIKDCRNNFRCLSNRLSPIVNPKNCDEWRLTTNHLVSSFENTHRITLKLKKKHHRRSSKNYNTMSSNHDETSSCNCIVYPCLSHIDHISHPCAYSLRGPPTSKCYFPRPNYGLLKYFQLEFETKK